MFDDVKFYYDVSWWGFLCICFIWGSWGFQNLQNITSYQVTFEKFFANTFCLIPFSSFWNFNAGSLHFVLLTCLWYFLLLLSPRSAVGVVLQFLPVHQGSVWNQPAAQNIHWIWLSFFPVCSVSGCTMWFCLNLPCQWMVSSLGIILISSFLSSRM